MFLGCPMVLPIGGFIRSLHGHISLRINRDWHRLLSIVSEGIDHALARNVSNMLYSEFMSVFTFVLNHNDFLFDIDRCTWSSNNVSIQKFRGCVNPSLLMLGLKYSGYRILYYGFTVTLWTCSVHIGD